MNANLIEKLRSLSRRQFFIFGGIFLAILVLAGGIYFYLNQQNNPYQKGMSAIERYEKLMRQDTYGGKTPEETLKLFVEALKKEDIELASKYFMLDGNGSREKWVNRLEGIKIQGLLAVMSRDIEERAKADLDNRLYEEDYKFVLYADDGSVGADIDMEFNKYSQLWKIESL